MVSKGAIYRKLEHLQVLLFTLGVRVEETKEAVTHFDIGQSKLASLKECESRACEAYELHIQTSKALGSIVHLLGRNGYDPTSRRVRQPSACSTKHKLKVLKKPASDRK